MFSASLIALREGLEAAIIIGIVLGYLNKIGRRDQTRYAWGGVILAIVFSVVAALVMRSIGAEMEEPFEQIFEGTTMLLAVAILTWMIFWMRVQGRYLKKDLERQVDATVHRGEGWGLFALAFLSVFREGIETALFLAANAFAVDATGTWIGALIGLAIAVAVGVLLYQYAVHLDVKLFFDVTSILLVVFAAGLVAHGIGEFQEIGWLPILTAPAWDTSMWLNNSSVVGSILRALLGYNDKPSLLEVISYIGYWLVIVQCIRWFTHRLGAQLSEKQV
ncbi:MAG: FTR1 family protein [Chloroflexi bacterium]|nr:FTR1 family protein [Chloroflexota bacterium]